MKPSRSIFTIGEAAEELGITLLDLLDYGQQGLIEVVINSDHFFVDIIATDRSKQMPIVESKGMMMSPDIMSEGPGGEVLLHGGFRALDY